MDAKLRKIVAFPTTENTNVGLSNQPDKDFRTLAEEIMLRTDTQVLLNEIRTTDKAKHVTVFTINKYICFEVLKVFKASGIELVADCSLTRMALMNTTIIEVIAAFEKMGIEVDFRCFETLGLKPVECH